MGQISASEGAIGGFGIGASSLSATGFFISGSSTGTESFTDTNLFISSWFPSKCRLISASSV